MLPTLPIIGGHTAAVTSVFHSLSCPYPIQQKENININMERVDIGFEVVE